LRSVNTEWDNRRDLAGWEWFEAQQQCPEIEVELTEEK
jgi:hypothetical protein